MHNEGNTLNILTPTSVLILHALESSCLKQFGMLKRKIPGRVREAQTLLQLEACDIKSSGARRTCLCHTCTSLPLAGNEKNSVDKGGLYF